MPRLMISYRRADTAAMSSRIHDRLAAVYGRDCVYMDVTSIPYGTDFKAHIRSTLRQVDALIVVIGHNWAGRQDGKTPRIHDRSDVVRFEVGTAIREGVRIIPVLVEGAAMPAASDLPRILAKLAPINAVEIKTGADFDGQMQRLLDCVDQLTPGPAPPTPKPTAAPSPIETASAEPRAGSLASAATAAVALLLASHYLIVVVWPQLRAPLWLTIAFFVIMLSFGAGLGLKGHGRAAVSAVSIAVGAVAVAGMLIVSGAIAGVSIVPVDRNEWREAIQYFLTICGAGVLGHLGAEALSGTTWLRRGAVSRRSGGHDMP